MASMFPTTLAMRHAKNLKLNELMARDIDLSEAMKDFQKVAVNGEFESAVIIFEAHIEQGKLSEAQIAGLGVIFDFTDVEVDGIIMDRVGGIVRDGVIEANKLAAAQLLHTLKNGDDPGAKGAVKKVIFELEG